MKLSPRETAGYFKKPDPKRAGVLIYGADAMRVAERRQQVILGLVGPEGEAEMRLTRIAAADLRKDPALLDDAIKAQGFFPGPRVAFAEEATDGLSGLFEDALKGWREGDAQIVVTAGQLNAKSPLRKVFEAHPNTFAIGIYDDPPSRDEINDILSKAGVQNIDRDAEGAIMALSRLLEPGDFRQTIEKLSLYKRGDAEPVSVADIDVCKPQSTEADLDDVLSVVAEARVTDIAPILQRLYAQGVNPVTLCIGATRHFRTLHAVASDPGGPGSGIGRLRPPVFGPRRDRIQRQASAWGMHKLERAMALLLDTDLTLRSTANVPEMAVMERALLSIAWMGRR